MGILKLLLETIHYIWKNGALLFVVSATAVLVCCSRGMLQNLASTYNLYNPQPSGFAEPFAQKRLMLHRIELDDPAEAH